MSKKLKQLKEKLRQAIRKELVEYDNLNTRKEKELEEENRRLKKMYAECRTVFRSSSGEYFRHSKAFYSQLHRDFFFV